MRMEDGAAPFNQISNFKFQNFKCRISNFINQILNHSPCPNKPPQINHPNNACFGPLLFGHRGRYTLILSNRYQFIPLPRHLFSISTTFRSFFPAIASVAERSPHLLEHFPFLAEVDKSVGDPLTAEYVVPSKLVEATGGGPLRVASRYMG